MSSKIDEAISFMSFLLLGRFCMHSYSIPTNTTCQISSIFKLTSTENPLPLTAGMSSP